MKILIAGVVILVMILVAGLAAMKVLEIGIFTPEAEQAGGGKPSVPTPEPPRFIDIEPLVIPVFHDEGVAATIQITVKLAAVGGENESRIRKKIPRLSDAFLKDLYAFIPRLLREQDRLSVFVIKKRMQMVGDRVVGAGVIVIDSVLVQTVTEHREADSEKK